MHTHNAGENYPQHDALDEACAELKQCQRVVETAQSLSLFAAGRMLRAWYETMMKMPNGSLYLSGGPDEWSEYERNELLAIQGRDLDVLQEALTGVAGSSSKEFQATLNGAGAAFLPDGLCFQLLHRPSDYVGGPRKVVIMTYKSTSSV